MTPTAIPIKIAGIGCTYPEAGVMQTNPATAPEAAPNTLGFPRVNHSIAAQDSAPAAAAKCVTQKALAARPSDASSLPALKPNQPTHSMAAPSTVYVKLCGGIGSLPYPSRLPITRAQIKADTPELMCTTVPPAKSKAPPARLAPVCPCLIYVSMP